MELKGHTIGFRGEYSATVLKADGTVKEFLNEEKTLRSGDVIKNLLLDNFFERLCQVDMPISSLTIRCGTGSNPVGVTQSSLVNTISLSSGSWPSGALTNNIPSFIDGGFVRASRSYTFTFSIGQIVGNISELGVNFTGSGSGTTVHSRALVLDNLGNPTTITVTSQEQLIITYTLKMEISTQDVVTVVPMVVNGTPTDVTVTGRIAAIGRTISSYVSDFSNDAQFAFYLSNQALGAVGSNTAPQGYLAGGSVIRDASYKQKTFTGSISQGNVPGGLIVSGMPSPQNDSVASGFKYGFNPPIPKNADRTLSITIRQTFGRLP